jgi:glucose/mannose-6-phosphate isomerase
MKITDFIKKNDPQNQFKTLVETHTQIDSVWGKKNDLSGVEEKDFNSIILCGLGGSAISGDLLANYLGKDLSIPFVTNRSYSLPGFVNDKSLVIISSYSGNTEETLSCFNQAINKKCPVVAITSGGEVEKTCTEKKISCIKIKKGFQPRYALGLSFFSLLNLFCKLNLIPPEEENVRDIKNLWKSKREEYSSDGGKALQVAKSIIGFIPIIYSSNLTSAVGYRFKCQLNENSKVHAFNHVVPEMNHNEIIGWESFKEKNLQTKIITILDKDYHPQVLKRFNIFTKIVSSNGVDALKLESSEKKRKVRIMDLIYLCDWISYYLAVLRGYDPSEIDYIRTMKKRLG